MKRTAPSMWMQVRHHPVTGTLLRGVHYAAFQAGWFALLSPEIPGGRVGGCRIASLSGDEAGAFCIWWRPEEWPGLKEAAIIAGDHLRAASAPRSRAAAGWPLPPKPPRVEWTWREGAWHGRLAGFALKVQTWGTCSRWMVFAYGVDTTLDVASAVDLGEVGEVQDLQTLAEERAAAKKAWTLAQRKAEEAAWAQIQKDPVAALWLFPTDEEST